MKRRQKLIRGEATPKDLAQALDNVGTRPGQPFWIETDQDVDGVTLCQRCLEPAGSDAWREVTAFDRPRAHKAKGTGSSLIAREPTGRVICNDCATKLYHGLAQTQESLL